MEIFNEHWDKLVFIGSIVLFFWRWRIDQRAATDEIINALGRLQEATSDAAQRNANLIEGARKQAAREHGELLKAIEEMRDRTAGQIEKLDEHTVTEHRQIAEALTKLATSLDHHIDDERTRRK